MKRYATSLVLGKFCPLHKGHLYVIETASVNSERLYVVVDNTMDEVIPVSSRAAWVREEFPDAVVLELPKLLPQSPEETDMFWDIWREELEKILPEKIECVFASEPYGLRLGKELDADFYPVDVSRSNFPVSATAIRQDLIGNWDMLADSAKRELGVKICVFGPESTGKSTLVKQLSGVFGAPSVDEYAVEVIKRNNRELSLCDMVEIMYGHNFAIAKASATLPPILFVDTDAITSKIWSEELFGEIPPAIEDVIDGQRFDLYLLTDIDLPWVNDIHRYRPDNRRQFFERCRDELELYRRKYVVINGSGNDRLNRAMEAVKKVFPRLGREGESAENS